MNRRRFLKNGAAATGIAISEGALHPMVAMTGSSPRGDSTQDEKPVVIENADFRLVISGNGIPRSLIHKATRQECLAQGTEVPMFTITQYRIYDNILQLTHPVREASFAAKAVRREGDRLIVSFPFLGYEAAVGLKITDAYVGFSMQKLEYKGVTQVQQTPATPIDESLFIQLPLRRRKNFGEWLNVMWDEDVAVNVLATDPYAKIDAKPYADYYLFQAGTVNEVRLEGVGAALITTATGNLLDRIAKVEEDFDLPRGVESRRCKEYRTSYYEIVAGGPDDIDEHVAFAQKGGLRAIQIYNRAFAKTVGHLPWRPEYPNGIEDLKLVVRKISDAGILPGVHIHYNKASKEDAYVTPKPDPRLNVRLNFTLLDALDAVSTKITIAENPRLCTMDDERRFLRIQNELIEYANFTTDPPYQFSGCKRGALGTQPEMHEEGSGVGLLDVDTWPIFVRFKQNTTIQQEVALRWQKIYGEAGFKFLYFDGAEDVPPPYWFEVSRAQWVVYNRLEPKPLFAEGAVWSHFSWHMLSRGNAFDVFEPEVMKAATRQFPAAEAARMAKDFTSINFGWIGYWAPGKETIGTQPDMLEYVTSRAAGWDCPISLNGELDQMRAHPRTPDNLAVLKRWEDVRAKNWLTSTQKKALRHPDQEHILLVNEAGDFELVPYSQVEKVAGGDQRARAFAFDRARKAYVVYWHTSGEGALEVPLPSSRVRLMKELGKEMPVTSTRDGVRLPLADRLYVECAGLSRNELTNAFQKARILS
jgi:hypothetical protein